MIILRWITLIMATMAGLAVVLTEEECSAVDAGLLKSDGRNVLVVERIVSMSCICHALGNVQYEHEGFIGELYRELDCGALRFFAKTMAQSWLYESSSDQSASSAFAYVETSAGDGLTASIVVRTVMQEANVPIISFVHMDDDAVVFADGSRDSQAVWSDLTAKIAAHHLQDSIIPILGIPSITMLRHAEGSVDMAYVNGNRHKDGVLEEIRAAWRALKVGGLLLGVSAYPTKEGINRVETALLQFCFERGMVREDGEYDYYSVVFGTSYMFHLTKEEGF